MSADSSEANGLTGLVEDILKGLGSGDERELVEKEMMDALASILSTSSSESLFCKNIRIWSEKEDFLGLNTSHWPLSITTMFLAGKAVGKFQVQAQKKIYFAGYFLLQAFVSRPNQPQCVPMW